MPTITLSLPNKIKLLYLKFKAKQLNFNLSKWMQDSLIAMVKRDDTLECEFFINHHCQVDGIIKRCRYVTTGKCPYKEDEK